MSHLTSFVVPGEPVPKLRPRFARMAKGVRTYTPAKVEKYEYLVGLKCNLAMAGKRPAAGAVRMWMRVYLTIPASWSKKKRQAAVCGQLRPTSRPDLDNVIKSVTDGMIGIAFVDDTQIISLDVAKSYASDPRVEVHVFDVGPEVMK